MRLKIRLEKGGFLPLMILLAVIFLSLAFIFGLFGLFSERVTAIAIDGDVINGDGEVCGSGEFRCGPATGEVCCQSDSENCVAGQCVAINNTPNRTFFKCELCVRYADLNGRARAPWRCSPMGSSVDTDFVGDVDGNDDFDVRVNCTDFEVQNSFELCRRYADLNGRASAPWQCANFGNDLLTDFVGDVDGNDDFDFMIRPRTGVDPSTVNSSCMLGVRYADFNGRAGAPWRYGSITGVPVQTDFVGNVDGNDDFDLGIFSCSALLLPPPQICGNGLLETGEQCDDGNTNSGDGCSSTCQIESPNNPKGNLDGLHCIPGELCDAFDVSCEPIQGWACDADNYKAALNVELYADGLRGLGDGAAIGDVLANRTREQAVGNECGNNTNHGFVFDVPASLKDGTNHQIYAYGINIGSGNDSLLTNSPITINCAPPPPPQICGNGVLETGEQCDDGNTDSGDGCSSTCRIESPKCILNSSSWSVNQTVEGNVVGLRVITTNCQGQQLSFEIKERDTLNPDDPVNINPANVFIVLDRGTTVTNWTAEWQAEGIFESDPPEYYFTATLVSTGQNIQSSNELQVYQQAPLLCDGVVTCSNYLNQQNCENDICRVANNSVPASVDCSDSDTDCSCLWNTTKTKCEGSWKRTSKGSDIGTCQYTENTADTCEDDGYLTVDLTARWIWDSGCDATCRADNQGAAAKCQSTTEIFQCPAQIPLPFFGFYNLLAAIVLITVIYWTISLKKTGKRAGRRR